MARGAADWLLPGAGVDRRAVAGLAIGHVGADLFQGAIPALVPFLVSDRGFTYAEAGLMVLVGSLASSVTQPLAGLLSDRLGASWLAPFGLLVAAAGLAAGTSASSVGAISAAFLVGGLGVALFHPPAVRAARMAAPRNAGSALGIFAVGGNIGFALGAALAASLAAAFSVAAAGAAAVVPALGAGFVVAGTRRPPAASALATNGERATARNWAAFAWASAAAAARSGVTFGLMAFVPSWFVAELDSSVELGSGAVVAMLVAGAGGTYLGGRMGDARGRGPVILVSLAAVVPLVAVLPASSVAFAFPLLILIGAASAANFYPLVLVAQDALSDLVGLASGVVIGLSVGIGAACTSGLGAMADAHGVQAALWGCVGLALLALSCAAAAVRTATPAHSGLREKAATPTQTGPD